MHPVVSVVIPAHNEEAVIRDCLGRLLEGTAQGEFDVVVVANACTDRTAEVATGFGVRVLRTPTPGKPNALRIGDEVCRVFPRVYLDADVAITADSIRRLVQAAGRPGILACAPLPELDLVGVGPVAMRLHRVHEQLIAPHRALAGAGVYLLTEQGHARVFPVPDVISDDGWVHGSFGRAERAVVRQARSVVRPARTVAAHLRRRVRVRQGNRQLAELGRLPAEGRLKLRALLALIARRTVSPLDVTCYLAVLVADRSVTRMRSHWGGQIRWGTDVSSRR